MTASKTSNTASPPAAIKHARAGLTIIEAVVSIAVVGVMLVAALDAVGASRLTQQKMSERACAMLLAEDLMSEILRQDYEDVDLAPGSFGLAGAEIGDGSRALFDDVDDYNGWVDAPPEAKDGTALNGFNGWGRSVEVDWVRADDFTDVEPSDTGVKRIIVQVGHDSVIVAELTALRTNVPRYGPETH